MVQITAVDAQKPCRLYHVKLLQHASSRFTMISMIFPHKLSTHRDLWSMQINKKRKIQISSTEPAHKIKNCVKRSRQSK